MEDASAHSSVSSATNERRLSDKSATKPSDSSTSDTSLERHTRIVSWAKDDKAAKLLGMDSTDILAALPTTSESSETSGGGRRRYRFGAKSLVNFETDDDDRSVVPCDGGNDIAKKFKTRIIAQKFMRTVRWTTRSLSLGDSGLEDSPTILGGKLSKGVSMAKGMSHQPEKKISPAESHARRHLSDPVSATHTISSRKSVVGVRRDNIDAKSLVMGLDEDSANFLDWVTQAKCEEWLKSLCRRDPRHCIKTFFDDVARDGADSIEQENGFQPELLSPLLSMFQRSSVFSVWRPTSVDAIQKMMTGDGTGKGFDIKGKSAKKGKLSGYVPFLQIHEDEHKTKIRVIPQDGKIRIFYKKREGRDKAHTILSEVMEDMNVKANTALMSLLESNSELSDDLAQDEDCVERVLSSFRMLGAKEKVSEEQEANLHIVNEWGMDKPSILVIDNYSPKCFGLDLPKRLFWEGYVMRAKDISREPGSLYDTGRPSRASFQDMNFASIKNDWEEDSPRAVVWQYTEPYLPPSEPDPDPMMAQTLLMAYEEHGRVMPVVSDFDCFLLGTRGVRFQSPLPDDQVELLHHVLGDLENILKDNREGKSNNWTASWLNVMKHQKKHHPMPRYGYGDPKSYAIMKYAVQRLEEFGAVRHGAECFNFYFPQELDDEFLVIGGNLGGAKYKYMKLTELQDFLLGTIDLGFTFPLNPKWTLCDEGWKAIWNKLTDSVHPNVQLSINAWYPPGSGLKERIESIHQKYPEGFQSDLSGRKKGTQAWDEAEIALDRYQRIQRAKRKMLIILTWIGIVQRSREAVQARIGKSEAKLSLDNGGDDELSSGKMSNLEIDQNNAEKCRSVLSADDGGNEVPSVGERSNLQIDGNIAEKRVSFEDPTGEDPTPRLSMTDASSVTTNRYIVAIGPPTKNDISRMGAINCQGLVRHRTAEDGPPFFNERFRRSSSSLGETEENADIIDSLINSNLCLSEFQTDGLKRIREQLRTKSSSFQPRVHQRLERRHTSIDGRMTAMMLEDVPLFILREYGGVNHDAAISFKNNVKRIMNAQRFLGSSAHRSKESANRGNAHFLPVEWTTMSKESKLRLAENLSFAALSRWDYNVMEVARLCDGSPLLFIGWAILGSPHAQQAMASDLGQDSDIQVDGYNFVTEFYVQMPILCSFLRTVEGDYLPNPYHNNTHAADVLQTLNTMLQLGGKEYASSPLDLFSILVAAVIHDVKHPGLNNNFQVNSSSDLAIQYNDVSVLENYSIMWLFAKLLGQTRDFTVDIFSGLSKEQFSKARCIIIRSVLETDMTHHFLLLRKMGIHQEMLKGKDTEEWLQSYTNEGVNYDPSMDMLCFLLHQADISNPAKPYPLFVDWADKILAESFAQGDKEASLSLPVSPLCDRVSTDMKQCQIGFIKFVVQPSYQLLGEIMPLFAKTVFPYIDQSLIFWDNYSNETDQNTDGYCDRTTK